MRLPGTCAGCGARIEAAVGERVQFPNDSIWADISQHETPIAWHDAGTATVHECPPGAIRHRKRPGKFAHRRSVLA